MRRQEWLHDDAVNSLPPVIHLRCIKIPLFASVWNRYYCSANEPFGQYAYDMADSSKRIGTLTDLW